MQSEVQKIITKLNHDNITATKLVLTCTVGNISFKVANRDILGGVIQEWFSEWLTKNGFYWKPPESTQTYPDFNLENGQSLELKVFNDNASPAFDLANFKSFINDLVINPQRLNADYLVFSYEENNDKSFSIKNFWCKKIWELTAIPRSNVNSNNYGLITCQIKYNNVQNLRPFSFHKKPNNCINSRREFVIQLEKTIEKYKSQLITTKDTYHTSQNWFNMVEENFERVTKVSL